VSDIIIKPNPGSPIYADGSTGYTLNIWAVDSGGNPVRNKQLEIVKNLDINYTRFATTNDYGYVALSISPSMFVCSDLYTVKAYLDNNTSTYITNSTTLSYIVGPAAAIRVIADPNAVANANVSTPEGAYDVHMTDIITTVTDQWGHPIPGQTVTVTSNNTTLGSITGPGSGTTSDSGEFTTQFTLNSSNHDIDTTVGVPVQATSGSLSGITHVLYTDNSFLSVKSTISPKSNVSVNDTINVNITVRGVGWKIRGRSYDVALIFDSSGSMDWLSTTIYPESGEPKIDNGIPGVNGNYGDVLTRTTGSGSNKRYFYDYDPRNWHYIDSFTYYGDGTKPIQIMLSSSYYNYSSSGTYYQLKVHDPNGNNYSTYEYRGDRYGNYIETVGGSGYELSGADYSHSSNENYVTITNPVDGATYDIYGAYIYRSSRGDAPYNLMVLTTPKRLGLQNTYTNDSDSAAKVAARQFVDRMTDNQVSIIWFNSSHYGQSHDSGVSTHLKTVNSVNKSTINNAINSLNAYYGTEIGAGIASAITELTGPYSNKSNKKVAILLSDGYSQTTSNDITQAYNARDNNITIYTIGIGMPDEYNLRTIANITGGNYTKVVSDVQLEHVYGDIAGELNKVVASETDMHIISNSTIINGTLYPDTEYVPGSAHVRYPNGTVAYQEPIINTNGKYELIWNPGVIKLNDTWTLNYQLKVLRNGTIEPITNESCINFTREDGSNDSATFTVETLYVTGNSSGEFGAMDKLHLLITDPVVGSHDTPYDINSSQSEQRIGWRVNYTGNYTYRLTVSVNDSRGIVRTIDNCLPGIIEYQDALDMIGTMPGDYNVTVTATEIVPDATVPEGERIGEVKSDYRILRRSYSNGQITLE
jgi:hypothetical protein